MQPTHDGPELPAASSPAEDLAKAEELPVVARMVIEIRSDGVRTMGRGAMEDVASGQKVAIEIPAMTPLQLSAALTESIGKALLETPGMARLAIKSLVPQPLRKLKRRLFGKGSGPSEPTDSNHTV